MKVYIKWISNLSKIAFFSLLFATIFSCNADTKSDNEYFGKKDSVIFRSIVQTGVLKSDEILERFVAVSKLFLQTPYKSNTLDQNSEEKLVVNMHELDCVTFVENCLALSQIEDNDSNKMDGFVNNLRRLRYGQDSIEDYTSRLHYFSDWLNNLEEIGLIKNITSEIGGIELDKRIDFMSVNSHLYPKLKSNTDLIGKIKLREAYLNNLTKYYIPEEKFDENIDIKTGDIVAITCNIKGLDVSHLGIAIELEDEIHLIHASSKYAKVVLSSKSLKKMILDNKIQNGIIVARLINK
ncbi:MAG: DUF1460 domain-containing protein [Marinifilaceae bacterium]|jgi:hypothetical protein|nr:DUF1460 domain-containing protein [Marinifilaceae bacterium]